MEGRPRTEGTWPVVEQAPSLELLKPKEAAKRYRINETKLYQLVKDGTIPHIPLGRRILLRPQAIDDWLLSLEKRGH